MAETTVALFFEGMIYIDVSIILYYIIYQVLIVKQKNKILPYADLITLILVFILGVLWLLAPKIILKPDLPNHTYDIRIYVARFRRTLLTTTILLEILSSLPFGNPYLTLIFADLVLIFSTAFLVEFRGNQ